MVFSLGISSLVKQAYLKLLAKRNKHLNFYEWSSSFIKIKKISIIIPAYYRRYFYGILGRIHLFNHCSEFILY